MVEVPELHAEAAAAALDLDGLQAVHIEQHEPGLPAPIGLARPLARLTAGWAASAWASAELLREALVDALAALGVRCERLVVRRQSTAGWETRWRGHFPPHKAGRTLWVVPSWEEHFQPPRGALCLHLDPSVAFGTGQHPSTLMCLRAVEDFAEGLTSPARQQASMLDVGCGTGILALAGGRLGLGRLVALDCDPAALTVAQANAERNRLALEVSGDEVGQRTDTFDLVVANILMRPLIMLAPAILARCRRGGRLVLSGLLRAQAAEVVSAYRGAAQAAARPGLRLARHRCRGDWSTLELTALS